MEDIDFTMYISNKLKIEKSFKSKDIDLIRKEIMVRKGMDLVVQGLTFITFNRDTKLIVYSLDGVNIYTRKKFI